MLKGVLKACRPPKMSNEMKCTNEKMTEIPWIQIWAGMYPRRMWITS